MEVRGTRYSRRTFLLGCQNRIYARAKFGEPIHIQTLEQFAHLHPRHRIRVRKLPYKRTYGLPIEQLTTFRARHTYVAPRGAIGIVVYR